MLVLYQFRTFPLLLKQTSSFILQLVFSISYLYLTVCPENIDTDNIIQTEQVIFKNTYVCTYTQMSYKHAYTQTYTYMLENN